MSSLPSTTDFLVVGGGVVGISIALELRRRHPDQRVVLIEKETAPGMHASGRNSGVLHAGFYYTADSLKARLTREGNRRLTEYCEQKGIRINRCGKLVVARNEGDLEGLAELERRGAANGVVLESITAADARRIEPRAFTHERAIYSPATSSVNPSEVIAALVDDCRMAGVEVVGDTAYARRQSGAILTTRGRISAGFVVNAAGLYADRVARDFDFSGDYRVLPFKGVYLYGSEEERLRTNVYPVPDLRNPFLGVHFTVTAAGRVKIGPTAIPAFWREQYRGLERFRGGEMLDVVGRQLGLIVRNDFGFRKLAATEIRKYSRRQLVRLASALVPDVDPARYRTWGPSGIRAQLLNIRTRRLEMDFRIEGDDRSVHVLNAVSPGFTCALTFAEYVVDHHCSASPAQASA